MNKEKRRRLEKAGWKVGDAADFLNLSLAEARFVELKLALAHGLRVRREEEGLTQQQVARRMGSSQSRLAKMEAADSSVSIDLLVRAVLTLGATRAEIARLVRAGRPEVHAVKTRCNQLGGSGGDRRQRARRDRTCLCSVCEGSLAALLLDDLGVLHVFAALEHL